MTGSGYSCPAVNWRHCNIAEPIFRDDARAAAVLSGGHWIVVAAHSSIVTLVELRGIAPAWPPRRSCLPSARTVGVGAFAGATGG